MFSKERDRRERRGEGYKRKRDSWSGNPKVMRWTDTHTHTHAQSIIK